MTAAPNLTLVTDPSNTPGAWERELSREVPGGVVVFHEAPAGWLTKAGDVRVKPYREYRWIPDALPGMKALPPKRLPSVSTIRDAVCPKDGLPHWAEARGIEGAVIAVKAGLVYEDSRAEDAIALVREHWLGADAAKNLAADRGLDLHVINAHYMLTGEAPRRADYPEHLCQRCHLQIQGKVQMARVWPWEHSSWFRPYVAGYYASVYLGEELERSEVDARLDELLALERAA